MTTKRIWGTDTVISLHKVSHCCSEEHYFVEGYSEILFPLERSSSDFLSCSACVILSDAIILPAFCEFNSSSFFEDPMWSVSMKWTLQHALFHICQQFFFKYIINIVLFVHFLLICNLEILAFICFRPHCKYIKYKSHFKYLLQICSSRALKPVNG